MEAALIIAAILGYAFCACLMLAFWSRIPPPHFLEDVAFAVMWPPLLLVMGGAAFVDSLALKGDNGGLLLVENGVLFTLTLMLLV